MSLTLKVLIAVSVTVVLALAIGGSTGASLEPQTVRVTLTDNQITLSQLAVVSDRVVILYITNTGELTHKLVVEAYPNENNTTRIESPVIGAHTTQPVQFKLVRGLYRILCVRTDHAERGMVTSIAAQRTLQEAGALPFELTIPLLALVLGSAYIIADTLGLRPAK